MYPALYEALYNINSSNQIILTDEDIEVALHILN
jgi:hypothetical protein